MLPNKGLINYLSEYYYKTQKRNYIICVDFDDTLCLSDYPNCGEPIQPVVDYIKYIQEANVDIVLWTCRTGQALKDARTWCKEHGIRLDHVNEQAIYDTTKWSDTRKVFCDMLIDDTSYNFNVEDFEEFMRGIK